MSKEFIPWYLADELKELGFEGSQGRVYLQDLGMCEQTLWQQAFRWFREKYELNSHIEYISASNQYQWHIKHYWETFDTYEEAELACLKKLIEIAKNK